VWISRYWERGLFLVIVDPPKREKFGSTESGGNQQRNRIQEIVVLTELRCLEVLQEVSLGRLKPISAIGLTLPLPSQLLV
jgi:hypothetical protein